MIYFIHHFFIPLYPKYKEMVIGNKLKAKRTEKKLSAEYIADKIGVDISTYRKYERDEVSPSIEKLEKIANALEIPLFSLFPDTFVENNDYQNGGVAILYNHTLQLSEKAIEKCEEQIKELKQDKEYLKEEIKTLKEEIKILRDLYK